MEINKQHYWLVTLRDHKGMTEERYTSSTNKNMTAKRLATVKNASSVLTAPMVVICCCYLGEMTNDEWDEDWT